MVNTYYVDSKKDNYVTLQALLDTCKGQEAVIVFQEGNYYLDKGLLMTDEHCGITLRAEGKVSIRGGKPLATWRKLADQSIAQRFDEEIRDYIYVCDLKEEGIDKIGEFVSRGYNHPISPSHSELFCNHVPMNLSQYPKGEAFLTISEVGEEIIDVDWNQKVGSLEGGFYFDDERPRHWATTDQLCVLGYWSWDWANSTEIVEILDTEKGFIKNAKPYGVYNFRAGQRFRFYHILEEVNCPGDYYIDGKTLKAYIYPEKMTTSTEVCISLLSEPMLTLRGSKDITIEGITFEMTCGHGLLGEKTENVVLDKCCFRNIGNYAIEFIQGHGNSVLNSDIHDCGDGGIMMLGGNRCTLESAGSKVCNNHMHHIAKWTKCYQPPITFIGVGMTARHNLIHDCPHTAIMYWGNDMTIEDNEIYSVVMETGDAGAIYTGRDYTFRGNRVCHNYIHHLGGVGIGTMGIYNDDCCSGTIMNDNYFEEVSKGAFMGGGRDFVLHNNVFVKCYPAIAFDCRGADDHKVWRKMVEDTLKDRFYHISALPKQGLTTELQKNLWESLQDKTVDALSETYITRYPELVNIHDFYSNPINGESRIPGSADIAHNVICSKVKFTYRYIEPEKKYYQYDTPIECDKYKQSYIRDTSRDMLFTIGGERGELYLNSNYPAVPEDFEDASWGDLTIKANSKAYGYGYKNTDFYSIGLEHIKRINNPAVIQTRIEPSQDYDQTLLIGMRNKGAESVRGVLKVYAKGKVTFSINEISFSINSGKEMYYPLEILNYDGAFEIEVRSEIPGVRPSRYAYEG